MEITIRQFVEIVGVSAVVLSLLFVGYELRLARSIAESEGLEQATELYLSLNEYKSSNADVWARGCMAEDLTPAEEIVFSNIAASIIVYRFNNWLRSGIGISTYPAIIRPNSIASDRYNFPGFNALWEKRGFGTPEFREAVKEQYEFLVESNAERSTDVTLCG